MKIRSVGAELFYTEMKQLLVAFRIFSKAPNKPNINHASKPLPYLL
jgi:hypothetical protein